VVENVEAYDNAYYGLDMISSKDGTLSAANGTVRNSSFYNHTGDEGHGLAINQGHDITVSDSVAYHNTIHGFDVSDWPKHGELSYNITLERNFSYDNGVAGFAINSDSHHVVYRNNVAWRNGADWAGLGVMSGFWCYEGCWHVEWVNNVSLENTDAGFWVEDQLGIYGTPQDTLLVFKNNIAYNNDPEGKAGEEAALVVEGDNIWQVVATHNDWSVPPGWTVAVYNQGTEYTPAQINGGAFQTGNISVDPQFMDATVPDVHLQPGLPCIDAGVDVGLPYLGSAPDMGAFEFEPSASPTDTPVPSPALSKVEGEAKGPVPLPFIWQRQQQGWERAYELPAAVSWRLGRMEERPGGDPFPVAGRELASYRQSIPFATQNGRCSSARFELLLPGSALCCHSTTSICSGFSTMISGAPWYSLISPFTRTFLSRNNSSGGPGNFGQSSGKMTTLKVLW
jgi:hypothetical protein